MQRFASASSWTRRARPPGTRVASTRSRVPRASRWWRRSRQPGDRSTTGGPGLPRCGVVHSRYLRRRSSALTPADCRRREVPPGSASRTPPLSVTSSSMSWSTCPRRLPPWAATSRGPRCGAFVRLAHRRAPEPCLGSRRSPTATPAPRSCSSPRGPTDDRSSWGGRSSAPGRTRWCGRSTMRSSDASTSPSTPAGRWQPAPRRPCAGPTRRRPSRRRGRSSPGWSPAPRGSFIATQLDAVLWSSQWNVGIVDAPVAALSDPSFEPTVRWLPAMRAAEFRADPFALARPAALPWRPSTTAPAGAPSWRYRRAGPPPR